MVPLIAKFLFFLKHFSGLAFFLTCLALSQDECLRTACALLSSSSHGVLASFSGSNKLIGSLLLELYSSYSRGMFFLDL